MRKLTVGSLFSGIGGLDLAARWTGFRIKWQNDNNVFCQAVLRNHFYGAKLYRCNIEEIQTIEPADVVVGGPPCQPASVAGRRGGKGDARYLWPEMRRIIGLAKPRMVLFENVPGIISLGILDTVLDDLAADGYTCWPPLLVAAAGFGPPHQRYRIFVVAHTHSLGQSGTSTPLSADHDQQRNAQESERQEGTERRSPLRSADLHRGRGHDESRLGRELDGLSYRLDKHQWPAYMWEQQKIFEQPRVVKTAPEHRYQRVEALGNAVVPQQVMPIFVAMKWWLNEHPV